MARGGSNPLGRIGKAPEIGAFSFVSPARSVPELVVVATGVATNPPGLVSRVTPVHGSSLEPSVSWKRQAGDCAPARGTPLPCRREAPLLSPSAGFGGSVV